MAVTIYHIVYDAQGMVVPTGDVSIDECDVYGQLVDPPSYGPYTPTVNNAGAWEQVVQGSVTYRVRETTVGLVDTYIDVPAADGLYDIDDIIFDVQSPVAQPSTEIWSPEVTQSGVVGTYDGNGFGAYVSNYWTLGFVYFQYMAAVDTGETGTADTLITVSLPVDMNADYNTYTLLVGTGWFIDFSAGEKNYPVVAVPYGTDKMAFLRTDESVTGYHQFGTTAGGGFTLAEHDSIRVSGFYLPA